MKELLKIEHLSKYYGVQDNVTKALDDVSFTVAPGEFVDVYKRQELTWLRDREEPYNLGDNEIHLAFTVDDMEKAMELHKEMDCVCYENPGMGIYFISDPDGYWLEIVPEKKN